MKIQINQFNVNAGAANKFKKEIYRFDLWHKIQIENVEGLDRDFVLKTLMKAVHPLDLIPVSYEVADKTCSFLVKNCGSGLESLCRQNLVIPNPNDADRPFKLTITLCFAKADEFKVDVQTNVVNVLRKRFSFGVLNLEQFHKDPGLNEFCPLSQPKLLFYILHLSKGLDIKALKLANNDIEVLKPVEALFNNIATVDLRNNNISDITEVSMLSRLNITELWLDGNPICDNYDEFTYGPAIKEVIPSLQKLDGVPLATKQGFLPFRRNFLCNPAGHDLVDQFLEHYFTIYDLSSRNSLDGIYHKQAMFSLTSQYLMLQSTSQHAKLSLYKQFSRNIKQISDFSKNDTLLFRGSQCILKKLNCLPPTEHDPYTFTVDLMTYTDISAVIVVTGVFREPCETTIEVQRLLGFTRTFVLLAGQNGEYKIVNEQLHVTNATTMQAIRAFKTPKVTKPHYIQIPTPQTLQDKGRLIETMKIITGLNSEWAKNCLEDSQYNLKSALTTFVELYKIDKIPQSAFNRENEVQQFQQHESPYHKPSESLVIKNPSSKYLQTTNPHHQNLIQVNSVKLISPTVEKKLPETPTNILSHSHDDEVDLFDLNYMNSEGMSTISGNSTSKDETGLPITSAFEDVEEENKMSYKSSVVQISHDNFELQLYRGRVINVNREIAKQLRIVEGASPPRTNYAAGSRNSKYRLRLANGYRFRIERDLAKDMGLWGPVSPKQQQSKTTSVDSNQRDLPNVVQPSSSICPEITAINKSKTDEPVIVIHSDSDDGTALPLEFQSKSQKRISKKLQKAEEARLLNFEQVKQVTKAIKEQVREFKASIRTKNMAEAQRVADEMIKAYGSVSLQPWQHILHTLYPLDCKFARDYVYKGRTLLAESNLLREFDKICAVMECEHGDPKIGEKLFKGLLHHNPKALGVVVAYARQLLIKKRFADAGLLFESYMRMEPHNSVAARKQLNMLEVEFKRKFL